MAATAHGEAIHVAFHNGSTTANAMAPARNPTNQGSVVNTSADTWNNVASNVAGTVFTGFPLTNAAGALTTARLSATAGYSGYNGNGWGTNNKDWVMMEGWYGLKSAESIAVSNLPAAFTSHGYSVTIYGDANTTRTMQYVVGGATQSINDAATFSGSFAPHTVLFTGLTDDSFAVTGNPGSGDPRSAVNGLQIAANEPPRTTSNSIISVNLHYDATGALGSNDVAGVVPAAGWNNYDVGAFGLFTNYPFPTVELLYANGDASGARISAALSMGYNGQSGSGYATTDRTMYGQYLSWDEPGDVGGISFSNLPPLLATNGYDVFVYFDSDRADRTFTLTIGGSSIVGSDYGTYTGAYVEASGAGVYANYARFSALTNAGFSLHMMSDTGRAAVNGIQIVPHGYVPPALAISSFVAAPGRVTNGASATLRWDVLDATSLSISPGVGDVTLQTTNGAGSVSVPVAATTVFTLTATNAANGASAVKTARVVVGPPVPNLLVFLVDDMGWQDTSEPFNYDTNGTPVIGTLNQRYRTPAMEKLAASGMKFTAAYAQPVCTPTRCAIMTGKNAARHHVTNWTTTNGSEPGGSNSADLQPPSGWLRTGLAPTETNTLPRLLASAGYRTIHAGKAHFGCIGSYAQYPQNIGFDVNIAGSEIGNPASYYGTNNFGSGSNHVPGLEAYHGQDIFLTEALTLEMNQAIDDAVSNGTPFFAYMAHYAVHAPWNTDYRFTPHYPGLTGSDLAFATLIEGMDQSLGDIRAHLEDLGVAENTLVCFLSDNGGDYVNTPLRDKKGTLFEGGVRVPMIWSWAKTNAANAFQAALPIAAGSRQTDSVTAWDLYPTLLGMAGLSRTNQVDGRDLSGYLRGEPGYHRPQQFVIHFPHNRYTAETPSTLFRDGDWKLIHDYQGGSGLLFNLADDPYETTDLAASHPEKLMQMTRDMARELDRLGAQYPEWITNSAPVPPTMPDLPGLDLDNDGLSDLGEDTNANGLVDAGETDPANPDTDGDTTPDGVERRLGTDPLDPASAFAAYLRGGGGTPSLLGWTSNTGTLFRIESTPTLVPSAWTTDVDDVPGQSSTTTRALPPPGGTLFYRVMLK